MICKVFVTHFFEKKFRKLSRKYPKIKQDFKNVVETLEKNPFTGNRIKGCKGPVFKMRMSSQDMLKGKSGGYRLIYLLHNKGSLGHVFLLTIYTKSERENISSAEINIILRELGLGN